MTRRLSPKSRPKCTKSAGRRRSSLRWKMHCFIETQQTKSWPRILKCACRPNHVQSAHQPDESFLWECTSLRNGKGTFKIDNKNRSKKENPLCAAKMPLNHYKGAAPVFKHRPSEIANNRRIKKQDETPVSFQVCDGVSGDVSRSVQVC
jgi:hypothetical protein